MVRLDFGDQAGIGVGGVQRYPGLYCIPGRVALSFGGAGRGESS